MGIQSRQPYVSGSSGCLDGWIVFIITLKAHLLLLCFEFDLGAVERRAESVKKFLQQKQERRRPTSPHPPGQMKRPMTWGTNCTKWKKPMEKYKTVWVCSSVHCAGKAEIVARPSREAAGCTDQLVVTGTCLLASSVLGELCVRWAPLPWGPHSGSLVLGV